MGSVTFFPLPNIRRENVSDRPSLGLVSATTLVAASMIGVGVYTTSGFTLAALGSPERVILAWIVGGFIAICGAISYASLAKRFAESGGEYLFLARTLHPVAGVMAGFVSMLAGFTGPIAIAAIGLETYLLPLLGETAIRIPGGTIAIVSVLAAAMLHTIGLRGVARVQDAIVIVKLLMIATFIALATASILSVGNNAVAANVTSEIPPLDWHVFVKQLVWISFSYAGFNAAVYVAGEVRDPQRNVPRALIGGTMMVAILYVMLNAIFVYSAPLEVVTSDEHISQIAATSASAIGGAPFETLVRWVIIVSLLTSVSAMVMTGPRVYAKMADDGFLPKWFRFQDKPPVAAIWFQAALAIAAILVSSLTQLLGYLGLTLSICSALTIAMLFVLRWRGDALKLPLWGIPPAIYVIATLMIAVLYAISEPRQAIFAVATFVVGFVYYRWKR